MPAAATPRAIRTPITPAATSLRRDGAVGGKAVSDDMSRTSRNGCRGSRAPGARVDNTENDWDEEQRRSGREKQPADHSEAKPCILFAACAEGERHLRHADDREQ